MSIQSENILYPIFPNENTVVNEKHYFCIQYFTDDLTESEQDILYNFFIKVKRLSTSEYHQLLDRFKNQKELSTVISHFPSLLRAEEALNGKRTVDTLINSLLSSMTTEKTLFLPTKAILCKDFLISKFQTLSWILKIAISLQFSADEINEIRSITIATMFTLMSNDVYFSLLEDQNIALERRRRIAYSLITLWDCRCSSQNMDHLPSMLKHIWSVRDKIAPAFGTMIGTSELLRLTIEMDELWCLFIRQRLSDSDISKSLEEFIFGLSHEQISILKEKIRSTAKSLSREEVYKELDGDEVYFESDFDPRNFYQMFSFRRDNARSRRRMHVPGPKRTLEDYYMRFILEQSQELFL